MVTPESFDDIHRQAWNGPTGIPWNSTKGKEKSSTYEAISLCTNRHITLPVKKICRDETWGPGGQQGDLEPEMPHEEKKAYSLPGCCQQLTIVILLLCSALMKHISSAVPFLDFPAQERYGLLWGSPSEVPQKLLRHWSGQVERGGALVSIHVYNDLMGELKVW